MREAPTIRTKRKLSPLAVEAKQAASEEFEVRLWNNNPPEIGQAIRRLEADGHSTAKAKEKVFGVFLRVLIESESKKGLDVERFKTILGELK